MDNLQVVQLLGAKIVQRKSFVNCKGRKFVYACRNNKVFHGNLRGECHQCTCGQLKAFIT